MGLCMKEGGSGRCWVGGGDVVYVEVEGGL